MKSKHLLGSKSPSLYQSMSDIKQVDAFYCLRYHYLKKG